MRIKILRVIIIGLFVLVAFYLGYLQLIRGPYFYSLSKNNHIRVVSLEGQRGRILDRYGALLADNRKVFEVVVIPGELKDREGLFDFLSQTLQVEKEKLLETYNQKMYASFAPVVVREDITRTQAIVIEENKFRFPGLLVQEDYRRFYPYKDTAAHLLGYVGKISRSKIEELKNYGYNPQSVIGYSGVEEFYDRYLKGEEGGMQIEINSRGEQVRLLGLKEPVKGQDVTLTIDLRIQQALTELLGNQRGVIIVMTLDSGEILGVASSPSYDPNIFVPKTNLSTSLPFSDSGSPLLNRAISGQYPPGSIFKISVALCALKEGRINPHRTFHCNGYYKLGEREFRCTHAHGDQDLIQAIAHSCNVYFYHLGLMVGPELMEKYARLLGLGALSSVDLPYEARGSIPNPRDRKIGYPKTWYQGDTLNLSIGQGEMLTTPLQLVQMMATLAQNGKRVRPHVVKSIGGLEVSQSPYQMISVDQKSLRPLQQGLEAVVSDDSGTGHVLAIPGLLTAGKTGTAQAGEGRSPHAWFVGYSSSGKNRIAFVVFLEHGGASQNACRVARDLLMRLKEKDIL